jgi:hypothetical protein
MTLSCFIFILSWSEVFKPNQTNDLEYYTSMHAISFFASCMFIPTECCLNIFAYFIKIN